MTTESKLHILVMTADWQSALACIQSFGRKGHTVSIITSMFRHPNYASIFVKNVFSLDEKETDERAGELMHLVELKAIDLVVQFPIRMQPWLPKPSSYFPIATP